MGFTLKFHFSPNEYFTDSVLTKIYHMNYSVNSMKFHFSPNEYFMDSILTKIYHMNYNVNEKEAFDFESPDILKCQVSSLLLGCINVLTAVHLYLSLNQVGVLANKINFLV